MARYKNQIIFFGGFLLIMGLALALGSTPAWERNPWLASSFLALFILLYLTEPWLSGRSPHYVQFYLALQTVIVTILLMMPPSTDSFPAILYAALILRVMLVLPVRIGFYWIGVFMVIMVVGILLNPDFTARGVIFVYGASYFFVGAFALALRQVEEANNNSKNLLIELQAAHQKLQAYADQVEELVITRERNHLARELHDSVTQTIFSMTLTAETATIFLKRDPSRVASQLAQLQAQAESALAEMRSLIFGLRPMVVSKKGFASALNEHIETLKKQHGLTVTLQVEEDSDLPPDQARRLFRIVQEALNNVVKHAHTDQAAVCVRFEDGRVSLQISDKGQGFEPTIIMMAPGEQHMGLASMQERVEMLGGTFHLDSHPDEGTHIFVEIPCSHGGGA